MIRSLSIFAVFLLVSACPGQSAQVRYTGGEGRDPFSTTVGRKQLTEDPDASEKKLQSMVVQGIVASPSNPRAIVNGKIYRVGSELAPDIKISRIEKEGVFVMSGGKETLLTRPTQPPKGKTTQ